MRKIAEFFYSLWARFASLFKSTDPTYMETAKGWDKKALPLALIIHRQVDDPEHLDAFGWAIDWWNDESGRNLFLTLGEAAGAWDKGDMSATYVNVRSFPLVIHEHERDHSRALAFARVTADKTGAIMSATVYVDGDKFYNSDKRIRRRAAAHELGHVLGLAHDQSSWSVMHGRVHSGPIELKGNDKDYIEETY